MLSCRGSSLAGLRRPGAGPRRRALQQGWTRRPSVARPATAPGAGDDKSGAAASGGPQGAAASPTNKSGAAGKPASAGADAEAAARDVLYTSADLAAEAVGAAAGAAEAAADDAAAVADDAAEAAAGLASAVAREAEGAASDFVFATATMADAAAATLQGAIPSSPKTASSSQRQQQRPRPLPAAAAGPVLSAPELKRRLVQAVAGLDRGLGASLREARAVDALARRLERAAPAGDGGGPALRGGCWRLVWSSAFGGGSLGGSRPGPPAALTPLVLGGVFQCVDPARGTLDNVVELLAPGLAPPSAAAGPLRALGDALGAAFGGGGGAYGDGGDDEDDDPTPGVRLILRHDYEILPGAKSGAAATVRIVFEETRARALGPAYLAGRLPPLALPQLPEALRPPRGLRAATFDVTHEDDEVRVTRGDRGELRIFLRESGRDLDAQPIKRSLSAAWAD